MGIQSDDGERAVGIAGGVRVRYRDTDLEIERVTER